MDPWVQILWWVSIFYNRIWNPGSIGNMDPMSIFHGVHILIFYMTPATMWRLTVAPLVVVSHKVKCIGLNSVRILYNCYHVNNDFLAKDSVQFYSVIKPTSFC